MTLILRHKTDEVNYAKEEEIFQESHLRDNRLAQIYSLLENLESRDITVIGNRVLNGFFTASYLSEIKWAQTFWFYATEIERISFDLSLNVGKEILLEYSGRQRIVEGYYVGLKTRKIPLIYDCWYWEYWALHSLISRDIRQISNLKQIDTKTMFIKIAEYGSINPNLIDPFLHDFYLYLLKKDYKNALIAVKDIIEKITIKPDVYFKNFSHFSWKREHVNLQLVPYFRCMESVLESNQNQFNEHLLEALLMHKEWALIKTLQNEVPNSNISSGFVSIPLLVSCCLAYDKGMAINIKSDYIPEWLIRNEHDFM